MARKTYSENISLVQVMVDGLNRNKSNLPKGMEEAFVTNLSGSLTKTISLNSEQEKMKADLKVKTAELDKETESMLKMYSEAKKRVKMDIPKEQWREFGIEDKQ